MQPTPIHGATLDRARLPHGYENMMFRRRLRRFGKLEQLKTQPRRIHGVISDVTLLRHGYKIMMFTRRLRDALREERRLERLKFQPTQIYGLTLDAALLTHGYEIMKFLRRLRDILRKEGLRFPSVFQFESEEGDRLRDLLDRKYVDAFVDAGYGIAGIDLSICRNQRLPWAAEVGQEKVPWKEFTASSAAGRADRGRSIVVKRQKHIRYLESQFEIAMEAELGDHSIKVIGPVKLICNILLRHLYELIDLIDDSLGQERAPIETREFIR